MFASLDRSLEMSRHVRDHGDVDTTEISLPGPSEAQFGHHVRQLRRINGLGLDQLARRSGLQVDELEAIEDGRHGADVATLRRLAAGLNIGIGMMFALWERRAILDDEG